MDEDDLIRGYFHIGFSYKLIMTLHGVVMSLRTLKSALKRMGLRRSGVRVPMFASEFRTWTLQRATKRRLLARALKECTSRMEVLF